MGSPLGPCLADIFMGYAENHLFKNSQCYSPMHYFRYVDDSFVVFNDENHITKFASMINSVHPNLHFTKESAEAGKLPFLDVLVIKNNDNSLSTCIHRKPTWTGLYLHFFSFVPTSYKRNLVKNLFDRARRICSSEHLNAEIKFLFETLRDNGYPSSFIEKYSLQRQREAVTGPEKKPAYLMVPYLGEQFSSEVRMRVRAATALAFYAIEPKIVFSTTKIPARPLKDPLPPTCASDIVYQFTCNCGDSYVGRTERWLAKRADEHLPQWLMKDKCRRSSAAPTSAVTRHTMTCTSFDRANEKISYFKQLVRARHPMLLPFLEATMIASLRPVLCVQKQTVLTLALPWQ